MSRPADYLRADHPADFLSGLAAHILDVALDNPDALEGVGVARRDLVDVVARLILVGADLRAAERVMAEISAEGDDGGDDD